MATWIVGGALALIVGGILWKLIRDKRSGKGACACGGDCASCHGCGAACAPAGEVTGQAREQR